jgi:hypothetical protein
MQMELGEVDVSQLKFDLRSRDDIPRVLRGLQHLYMNEPLRKKIFELLMQKVAPKVDKENGRPGMTLWSILVCGVLRLDLNADYDRLLELINQHGTLREMLGHSRFDSEPSYVLHTVKKNVSLLRPELLDEINQLVVAEGHALIKKEGDAVLRGRCDSFVVETHVHFPTDINLLFDAMRKVIELTARLSATHDLSEWRQSAYTLRQLKRQMRYAQSSKRSCAKQTVGADGVHSPKSAVVAAHRSYLKMAQQSLDKARGTLQTLVELKCLNEFDWAKKLEIEHYMAHAERQIDQTRRRVLQGETIPHNEKVFSLFQPHTEWICKGKAGVPVELGVRVCVLEDQYRFILHHHVMEKQTDVEVATKMVREAQKRFKGLELCSFDKGFHSPSNQAELAQMLTQVGMPRKGRLSQKMREHEQSEGFKQARRGHAAVESGINALEVHGLDTCHDHGIEGFKRYVALAVLTRNIHRIGDIVWHRDKKREERRIRHVARESPHRRAAA